MIPDGVDGAANGRDVVAVGEHRISLFGNANATEFGGEVGEVGYFDAGDVVEIPGVVSVAADTIGHLPDPPGNMRDRLVEALPQAGNGGTSALPDVALAETGVEEYLDRLATPGV